MKHYNGILILALLISISSIALAQSTQQKDRTPGIDERQDVQKERIKQGVKSGELTKPEARKLVAEQKKIGRAEARAKSDGTVTKKERAKLHHELNKANRDIARQKHDRQKRK